MTEHPGEQFPPAVDPDVEPGYEPDTEEPSVPDYDVEPGPADHTFGTEGSSWDTPAADEVPDEGSDGDGSHPLVEETMARLGELRERPVSEHGEVYAKLHERLQTALVEADADERG